MSTDESSLQRTVLSYIIIFVGLFIFFRIMDRRHLPGRRIFPRPGFGRRAPSTDDSTAEKSQSSQSSSNDHQEDTGSKGPSPMDVHVTKVMLQHGLSLPLEVVLSILDHAEYWPHTTAKLASPVVVTSGRPAENKFLVRTHCLLDTLPRIVHARACFC